MLAPPADALYVWIGVTAAAFALLGVAVALPSAPAPDAAGAAGAVDRAVAQPDPTLVERSIVADEIRLDPDSIALRTDRGTTERVFVYGPITPVTGESDLWRVLRGAPPGQVFGSENELHEAIADARATEARWRPADGTLYVRSLSWEGVDVTLVGA